MRVARVVMCILCAYVMTTWGDRSSTDIEQATEFLKKSSLIAYLKRPHIPPLVLELANIGHKRYQKDPLRFWLSNSTWDQAPGGRPHNWLEMTFNQSEGGLVQKLANIDPPRTWRIDDINKTFSALVQLPPLAKTINAPS